MRLFSYCILVDDGAAPNPYWGICTLTICKPVIRRVAQVGDWVIAIGSSDVNGNSYAGRLVYAMEVTEILSLKAYDEFCRKSLPQKIPNLKSRDYRRKVGDCIYDFSVNPKGTQREGVHFSYNVAKDLRGKNALLSDHFYYFGNKAIKIPDAFSVLIRQGQGHQSHKNDPIKLQFIEWITSNYKPNHLYGEPQVQLRLTQHQDSFAKVRCDSASEDEKVARKHKQRKTH